MSQKRTHRKRFELGPLASRSPGVMVPNAFRNFSTVVRRTFPNLMEAFVKKVLHRSSSKKAATAGAARKTLFAPVVPSEKRSPSFEQVRRFPGSEPTRWMLDDVYDGFTDPDGNFLEQFQTAGFDARLFELYLFAYFSRSGFAVDRSHPKPDYLVSKGGVTVALEATTVNPSTSGALAKIGKSISDLTPEEILEYQRNELPIRFGSPLFSKLQKRYWELEHCKDLPFVLAIEAFHDDEALALTDAALSGYVYGVQHSWHLTKEAKLVVEAAAVETHEIGGKRIPSNFFARPGTEHVSAVLFTNTGTTAKFARMGYQSGVANDTVHMLRMGYSFTPDADAMDPAWFSYDLDHPPFVEPWGQGIVVLHNPRCLRPLQPEFFHDVVQTHVKDGRVVSEGSAWHPFASKTLIIDMSQTKPKLLELLRKLPPRGAPLALGAMARDDFRSLCGWFLADNPISEEAGWFTDETESFLGVVIRDKVDDDWGFVVLARDQHFRFRAIEVESSVRTRDEARRRLQLRIAALLRLPQRIFPQLVRPMNSSLS